MISREAILDILRLNDLGISHRKIANRLGIHRNTVKKHIEQPDRIGKYHRKKPYKSKLDAFESTIQHFLDDDPDYQATWIYEQLQRLGFDGSYEIVKRKVKTLKQEKHKKAYIRFETAPGCQAQVDFGTFKVQTIQGQTKTYYLFAMILGYSRKLYAELIEHCDMPSFLDCHIHAFHYFGGVPNEILYDRMKNVFVGMQDGKATMTKSMVGFALHYHFKPSLCPGYAPWVKGKIERPMSFIREGFWRGYYFTNIDQANRDLLDWLKQKDERIHGTTKEQVTTRFEREQPFLGSLPKGDFDTSFILCRKVHKDCTIIFEGNRYVVSHHHVGKKVTVRVKNKTLRIFVNEKLEVTYQIPETKGELVEDKRFYEALRKDQEMNKKKFGRFYGSKKGRAKVTISPKKPRYDIDVAQRSIADYESVCRPGVH